MHQNTWESGNLIKRGSVTAAQKLDHIGIIPGHEDRLMSQMEIYWLACACAPYLQRRFPNEDVMDIAHETFFLMLKAQKNWKGDMPLWKYLIWRARKGISAYVMRNIKGAHRRSDGSWQILERLTNE